MIKMNDLITQTRLKLYTWLKLKGITQEQAAEDLEISRSHLNKVLNGATKPSIDLLDKMIKYMEN